MACPCESKAEREAKKAELAASQVSKPFGVDDIQVIDHGEVFDLRAVDWPAGKHKVLIFIPEAFTPVCATELGAMNHWHGEFQKLGCELIAVCADSTDRLMNWMTSEPLIGDANYKVFSSHDLPAGLGILEGDKAKRATVVVPAEGDEVIRQEYFSRVGRSFAELHRMMYAYTTGEYCAEGWKDPSDGFVTPQEAV